MLRLRHCATRGCPHPLRTLKAAAVWHMFSIFSDKHAYQRIPEKCDEESRNRIDNYNATRTGTSSNHFDKGDSNMRFRGDKRLIERGSDFHQSTGKIALRKKIKTQFFRALYGEDLFHSLVDAPTARIILILLGTYMSLVLTFSLIYFVIGRTLGCNLDIVTFGNAFAFSLETMATIGYSTADIFFDDCPIMLTMLALQICVKLICDAVIIGVLYCKLSRPHARASTVIFSNHAVIRRIRGKLYFMFQLCELRKHQLVEAHVRVYVVRNEIDVSACFESDMYNEHPEEATQDANNPSRNPLHIKPDTSNSSQDGSLLSQFGSSKKDKNKPINQDQYHTLPSHHLHHSVSNTSFPASPHTASPVPYQTDPTVHNNNFTSHEFNPNYIPPNSTLLTQYTLRSTHRPSYMQTNAMRLNHPNDELGGMLLLMTPQVVVHEIDAGSPLMPPPVWYCNFAYDEVVTGTGSGSFRPPPFGPSGSGMQLGSHQAGDCIRWRPPAYRNFIHYVPTENTSGHSTGNRGASKGAKPVQAIHRYNNNTTHQNTTVGYVPPPTITPYSDDDSTASDNNGSTEPIWYYDAESLSRIDFPSVTRRIDTDNITTNSAEPTNPNNNMHYDDEENEVVDQTSSDADVFDNNTTYVSHAEKQNTTASHLECDYSMSGLASERASPYPVSSNDPAQLLVPQNSSHRHSLKHTPTHTEEQRKSLRFQSAGMSSYADLLNHMSPSPQHNNNNNLRASHYDLSPLRSPSGLNSANTSINTSMHKSMYLQNKPHSSLLVPILQAAPEPQALRRATTTGATVAATTNTATQPAANPVPNGKQPSINLSKATSSESHYGEEGEEEEVCVITDEGTLFEHCSPRAATPPRPENLVPPTSIAAAVVAPTIFTPPRVPPTSTATTATSEKKSACLPYPLHRGTGTKSAIPPPAKPTINPFPTESGGIATSDGTRCTPKQRTDTNHPHGANNVNYGATMPPHCSPDSGNWSSYTWQEEERSMVQRYLRDRQVEIIVIVEGVDAATGGMVQARHSYTSSEIEWDKSFECCVEKDPIDGCTTIDFSKFHQLCDVPMDAPFAGVVHSSI